MQIGLLLQKYAHLGYSQKKIKDTVLNILNTTYNFDITSENVEVKDTSVRIKVSGSKKTTFFLRKKEICDSLTQEFEKQGLKVSKIE